MAISEIWIFVSEILSCFFKYRDQAPGIIDYSTFDSFVKVYLKQKARDHHLDKIRKGKTDHAENPIRLFYF